MIGQSMTIDLRLATADDARTLYDWRNDPGTRAASFTSDLVVWEDHVAWLSRRLADPAVRLWIADGVGTVRAERVAPGVAELHVTVAPEARGQGRAAPLLDAAALAAGRALGVRRVFGRVKESNVASQRAFARAGFIGSGEEWVRSLVASPVVAIVQARMGSSRLPGKVLMEVCGRPLLAHMLDRVALAGTIDAVWVATTDHPRDDPVAELAAAAGHPVFRGSEDDVLARFEGAAAASGAGTVVRLTGDCPLITPDAIDLVVGALGASGADLATNAPPVGRTWPDGVDAEAFPRAALHRAFTEATDQPDREHVTRWFHHHARVETVHHDPPLGEVRITVDTHEDLARVRHVLETLLPQNPQFTLDDVLAVLEES
jgi:spore coat polysaccharide biosynthesis protein SpsF